MMRRALLGLLAGAALCAPPLLAGDLPVTFGLADFLGVSPVITLPQDGTGVPGAPITLIMLDPTSPRVTLSYHRLGPRLPDTADHPGGTARFAVDGITEAENPVGFAVLGDPGVISIDEGRVEADLTGDGIPEVLSACLASEGVVLTVSQRGPDDDRVVWQGYVPLTYDVDPNCP